jgi:iron-sulfur cluster assembly accessory protein
MATLELTDSAARQIQTLSREKATPLGGLRLGVRGGGCSGFSYVIEWEATPGEKDEVIEKDGARVFVDPKSAPLLAGTVVDYKKSLMQSRFELRNPNAKSSCGCGDSFAV